MADRAISRKARFFLVFLFTASVAVAQADTIDVGRFSVGQLKLYMTPSEVLRIAQRSHLTIANVERNACQRDAALEIKARRRIQLLSLPHRRCIRMLTIAQKTSALREDLWFVEDFPAHPDTMRLYSILFSQKNEPLNARQELERSLVARYGPPTLREQDVAAWCNRTEEHECVYSLEIVPPVNEIGVADFSFVQSLSGTLAGLSVQGLPSADSLDNNVEMELFDVPYAIARSAAIAKSYEAVIGAVNRSGP